MKKALRVALVGDYPLDPKKLRGGPQSVFSYLLEGLSKIKQLEIHVVTGSEKIRSIQEYRKENIYYHYLPHPRLPIEIVYPFVRRSVHKALDRIRPDLVHSQTLLHGTVCVGAGYPLLATLHNIPGSEPGFGTTPLNKLRRSLHDKYFSHILFNNIRYIISISEYIQQGVSRDTKASFYSIHNPVSRSFFDLSNEKSVRHSILFVGEIRKRKRPEIAIEAFVKAHKQIPSLTMKVAGAFFDQELTTRLRKIIAQNRLDESVELLGQLDEKRLLEMYRDCSTLLLTSDLETSPMAVQQAMAAGRPVVATDVGGVSFLIKNGQTGLLAHAGDVEGIASAIVRIERNENLHLHIAREAHKSAMSLFDCDSVAGKMYDAYRDILESEANN